MVSRRHESKKLTYRVPLPGGQERLKQIILYVSKKSRSMERFGAIKLNKIIWYADFRSYADRQIPVTGRPYQRLERGPAPVEMAPLLAEMEQDGLISIQREFLGQKDNKDIVEKRTVSNREPILSWFSPDDLHYVDEAIERYWNMTGSEASDDSHGMAWRARENSDAIPYEAVYLSDRKPKDKQFERVIEIARERGWKSR